MSVKDAILATQPTRYYWPLDDPSGVHRPVTTRWVCP